MTALVPGSTRSVFLCSRELGCPVNLSLTTRLHNYVLHNNWALTDAEAADFIVIVSCSTLPETRQAVSSAASYFADRYPSKKVVVTCCFVEEDRVRAPNVVYIPLAKAEEFDALFGATVPLRREPSGATRKDAIDVRNMRGSLGVLTRPYNVMVSAGCLNHCSFCIGKHVFPSVQSVPIADIVAECQDAIRKGYKNFVIGASDVASYGRDIGCKVTDLFEALFSQVFVEKSGLVLGFKGFEPSGLLRHFDGLKSYFATGRVSWISLPIQSGSDRVLESMNRKYRIGDVLAAMKELRRLAPGLRIETDVIFCFPTETTQDFEATLAVLDQFDHVQMLAFERHKDTKASALEDVFSPEERERRREIARVLQEREHDAERPECRPRIDISLPSPLGDAGFAVIEMPK